MRNLGNSLEIRHVVSRVSNSLHIDCLGAIINSSSNILCTIAIHKLGLNAQPRQKDLELVVGTAVEVAGSDNVVAGVGQGRDGHELGCLAGRSCNSGNTTFESGDAFFEDVDGGLASLVVGLLREVWVTYVHDAGVDVAELFEAKESGAVSRVIEDEGLYQSVGFM